MQMKGIIFDIQRASFVDGNGARTTVFFKGCNLRCKWCHNPEGIKKEKELLYFRDRCTDCKKCVSVCPKNGKECTLCGKCALFCPSEARELCGREYGIAELLEIIERDKNFYEETGGGVTFSGGECMLQIDFLEELLRACREKGINTAVDTAGNVPWEYFERVLPFVNTFLYDIKCINKELHIKGTGVDNALILENYNRLALLGADIVVRVPVIGGFNDSEEEMRSICALLRGNRAELLSYHDLGAHKYDGLNMSFCGFYVPKAEKMDKFRKMFKEN